MSLHEWNCTHESVCVCLCVLVCACMCVCVCVYVCPYSQVAMKWYRYLDTPAGHANYANEAAIHTYLNQFSSHPNVMTAIAQGYEQSLNMATLVFLAMTGDMRG